MAKDTIIYKNGGDYFTTYYGITKKLAYWIWLGRSIEQSYMYKGFHWYDNKSNSVIVYTKEKWDGCEIERRRNNGFLGIREYQL